MPASAVTCPWSSLLGGGTQARQVFRGKKPSGLQLTCKQFRGRHEYVLLKTRTHNKTNCRYNNASSKGRLYTQECVHREGGPRPYGKRPTYAEESGAPFPRGLNVSQIAKRRGWEASVQREVLEAAAEQENGPVGKPVTFSAVTCVLPSPLREREGKPFRSRQKLSALPLPFSCTCKIIPK